MDRLVLQLLEGMEGQAKRCSYLVPLLLTAGVAEAGQTEEELLVQEVPVVVLLERLPLLLQRLRLITLAVEEEDEGRMEVLKVLAALAVPAS